MICFAGSDLARPTRALQAKALMESASVIGVLMLSISMRAMMPLLDLTASQILLMISSGVLTDDRFLEELGVVLGPEKTRVEGPGLEIGAQTQLIKSINAERRTSADS